MGPWFIRDEASPHRPGCSYETVVRLVARGRITPDTVVRGPTTLQFWTLARWCPGVAHLLGACHSCHAPTDRLAPECSRCGATFRVGGDRQSLGLGEVRYVPGRPASAEGAGEAVEAPSEVSGDAEAEAAPARGVAEVELEARMARAGRELARARRWRAVWAAGFLLLAAGWLVVLVAPALDLDAGPVGRWIHGVKKDAGEVKAPDLPAGPTPQVSLPLPAGEPGQADAPAGSEQSTNGVGAPEAGGSAPSGEPSEGTPGAGGAGGESALSRLRKLR